MIITPTEHNMPNELSNPAELLIKEARQKARRRRLTVGAVLLVVSVVIAAALIVVGRGPTNSKPPTSNNPGGATGTNYTLNNVVNLAGSNTLTASGSHVWIAIDRENPSANFFAVTELDASNGSLVRVIKDKGSNVTSTEKNQPSGDLTEPGAGTVSGSHLWVTDDQYGNVTELNASNGSLVRVINAKTGGFKYPGDIAVSAGHVWVTNSQDGANSVTELNASNGSLVRVINAKSYHFSHPDAVVSSGSHVYVLNSGGDSITELNATSGALVRIISTRAVCCAPRQGTFESAEPIALAHQALHRDPR